MLRCSLAQAELELNSTNLSLRRRKTPELFWCSLEDLLSICACALYVLREEHCPGAYSALADWGA